MSLKKSILFCVLIGLCAAEARRKARFVESESNASNDKPIPNVEPAGTAEETGSQNVNVSINQKQEVDLEEKEKHKEINIPENITDKSRSLEKNSREKCIGGSCENTLTKLLHSYTYDYTVKPAATSVNVGIMWEFEYMKWNPNAKVLSVSANLIQKWNDPRFVREGGVTRFKADDIINQIWEPSMHVMNTVNPTQVVHNGFVDIQTNGNVIYSKHIQFQIYCSPNKKLVSCDFQIKSYPYDTNEVTLYWSDEPKFDGVYHKITWFRTMETGEIFSVGNWDSLRLYMKFKN